ncbi:MAG: FAD-dependent monooxygenase [Planctomycetes bacterium]|nr:FAD-dependent monooxygenase [Planctomycetota bacterium]MCC7169407.1 FAD-dependent monooxygenase [Planctomycetota bacterium]
MNIVCVGGGPAGLYFSILFKKAHPDAHIVVHERNRPDDTFGFGVVFSAETLSHFGVADPETYRAIQDHFVYWDDIDTFFRGSKVTSTGHGFCGLARVKLLEILQRRARSLGVDVRFQSDVVDPSAYRDADLVLACDGVNSAMRERYAATFKPTIEWGKTRFTWLGARWPLTAFTFLYRRNEHGLFQVHAYPYQRGAGADDVRSTFIVECTEDAWTKAGFEAMPEADMVRYFERLFADDLKGAPLLTNRSIWRRFPFIKNERWYHDNVVLLGDAAHTAHFSIGSGTKLAMEDAIALADACSKHAPDVPRALAAYQESRWLDVAKLQRAASTSQSWFEHTERYERQDAIQFTFNQMTRSKKITWDNLHLRDPKFVDTVKGAYATHVDAKPDSTGAIPVPAFTPYSIGSLRLANRIVVSPMCMYSAVDGTVNDWHLVHLGSRAVGGAGLLIAEMTDVSADGRITPGCAGLYADAHVPAWKRIVDFVHQRSASKIAVQLAHAGRKGSSRIPWEAGYDEPLTQGAWPLIAPSAIPWSDRHPTPKAMDAADLARVKADFVRATQRANEVGFDLIELHMAHGYLLSSFLSPSSNQRTDAYGGSLEHRMRFPLEVLDAVRAAWPASKPIAVRISASDWLEPQGMTADDAVVVARALKRHGCDIVDVSAGGTTPHAKPVYGRMFQVHFSDQIRHEADVATMTVGNVQSVDHVNTILAAGRADLVVLARAHLADPYLTLHAAERYEFADAPWPNPYLAVKPSRRKGG